MEINSYWLFSATALWACPNVATCTWDKPTGVHLCAATIHARIGIGIRPA